MYLNKNTNTLYIYLYYIYLLIKNISIYHIYNQRSSNKIVKSAFWLLLGIKSAWPAKL